MRYWTGTAPCEGIEFGDFPCIATLIPAEIEDRRGIEGERVERKGPGNQRPGFIRLVVPRVEIHERPRRLEGVINLGGLFQVTLRRSGMPAKLLAKAKRHRHIRVQRIRGRGAQKLAIHRRRHIAAVTLRQRRAQQKAASSGTRFERFVRSVQGGCAASQSARAIRILCRVKKPQTATMSKRTAQEKTDLTPSYRRPPFPAPLVPASAPRAPD